MEKVPENAMGAHETVAAYKDTRDRMQRISEYVYIPEVPEDPRKKMVGEIPVNVVETKKRFEEIGKLVTQVFGLEDKNGDLIMERTQMEEIPEGAEKDETERINERKFFGKVREDGRALFGDGNVINVPVTTEATQTTNEQGELDKKSSYGVKVFTCLGPAPHTHLSVDGKTYWKAHNKEWGSNVPVDNDYGDVNMHHVVWVLKEDNTPFTREDLYSLDGESRKNVLDEYSRQTNKSMNFMRNLHETSDPEGGEVSFYVAQAMGYGVVEDAPFSGKSPMSKGTLHSQVVMIKPGEKSTIADQSELGLDSDFINYGILSEYVATINEYKEEIKEIMEKIIGKSKFSEVFEVEDLILNWNEFVPVSFGIKVKGESSVPLARAIDMSEEVYSKLNHAWKKLWGIVQGKESDESKNKILSDLKSEYDQSNDVKGEKEIEPIGTLYNLMKEVVRFNEYLDKNDKVRSKGKYRRLPLNKLPQEMGFATYYDLDENGNVTSVRFAPSQFGPREGFKELLSTYLN